MQFTITLNMQFWLWTTFRIENHKFSLETKQEGFGVFYKLQYYNPNYQQKQLYCGHYDVHVCQYIIISCNQLIL